MLCFAASKLSELSAANFLQCHVVTAVGSILGSQHLIMVSLVIVDLSLQIMCVELSFITVLFLNFQSLPDLSTSHLDTETKRLALEGKGKTASQ